MIGRSRSALLAAVPVLLATMLTGCGAIRPPGIPPVLRMPRLGEAGAPTQSCTTFISTAHAALATAGTDPAAAHAGYAMAIHEYHTCLVTEAAR